MMHGGNIGGKCNILFEAYITPDANFMNVSTLMSSDTSARLH